MEPDQRAVALAPHAASVWLRDAIEAGGGRLVDPASARALVWTDPDAPGPLAELLGAHPAIELVQLPWAGIEPYLGVVRAHPERTWACAKGVYAAPVAEHALALALAGLRNIHGYSRARAWTGGVGVNLLGAEVVVLGAGGIARSLLGLLDPFGCRITVVRRSPGPVDGADAVVGLDQLDEVLPGATVVVLALALTPATTGLFDRRRLGLLASHAWLVNVARGAHVVTDDLVAVLAQGRIAGAALDVTDPEPLPAGHPLWSEPRCIITPHTGNTPEMAAPLLAARVADNVRRWVAGAPLVGLVDVDAGY